MLRRRDIKGSNRREGAEADTAVLALDRDKVPTTCMLFLARYGHGSERSRMCWRVCLVLALSIGRPVRLSRLGVERLDRQPLIMPQNLVRRGEGGT